MATSQNKKIEAKKSEPKIGQIRPNEAPADASAVKRKLAWRMGLAGLMIVGLLGGLALFDRMSTPGESEPSAPEFTEPVPVAKKMITQPVTPAEPSPDAAKEASKEPAKEAEKVPATPESSAPPVDKTPHGDRPARPEVAAQPALPRTTPPAARAAAASPRTAVAPAVTSNRAEAPVAVVAPPRAVMPPSAPPRLFSGYALQAGVFSELHRAEELHARLVLEGIPATIEARVQVGPFASRAEADAAREKMKAMGIDTVLLLPKGAKR